MKRLLLAVLAAATLSLSLSAQNNIHFIIQGGYQGAKLTSLDKSELQNGFRIGAAVDWMFMDFGMVELGLQPGINFSQKGGSFNLSRALSGLSLSGTSGSTMDAIENVAAQMNYMDIPILLNARIDVPVIGTAFVQAGGYVAFGIGSNAEYGTGLDLGSIAGGTTGTGVLPNIDLFKQNVMDKIDYGFQIGAGVEFVGFQLTAGYQLGLKDLGIKEGATVKEAVTAVEDATKAAIASGTKNSAFFVSVGYRF